VRERLRWLDSGQDWGHVARVKRRLAIGFVCWLYVSVALLTGLLQHDHAHRSAGPHKDCAACALQINQITDVPVVSVPVLAGQTVAVTVAPSESVFSAVFFALATASRAPPGGAA